MGRRTGSVGQNLLTDFEFFAPRVLRIRAKDGAIIPFALNQAQQYLHNRIEEQRKKTGRVRAIGLKGRQQGFSTYVQGRYFWRLLPSRGQRAFILTHEQEATNNLFEITERFCNEAPFLVEPDKSNAKELHFTDQDSGYKVGTAGNKAVGRSSTIQLFHGSEAAYWPNADAHKAGVIQAVPDLPGTEIILESTANGVGGMFHELWVEATEGRNEYMPIFIPWFWQDEYRKDTPQGFKRTPEEQKLVKLYKLDDRQLAWRRAKIGELKPSEGGNPEDLFNQEYPCLVGGTRISTARGIVPMSEVVAGDIGDRGIIERQWSTGIKPVFEIETSLGYRITATANHPIALDGGGFVTVSDAVGARVLLQIPMFAESEHVTVWRPAPCVESRFVITAEMGRFLGYFMGDGSYSANTLSIACDGQDADVVYDASILMQAVTGRANTRAVGTKRGGVEVRTGFKYGRELLAALGVIEGGDRVRRKVCVPDGIWRSPQHVVREFLRGLFESDGFAGDVPKVVLFSRYRQFLQDVQLLLLGFGITARLRTANKVAGDGHTYIGNELALRASEARLFAELIGFVSSRKNGRTARWLTPNGIGRPAAPVEIADRVTSITPRGEAEVFDLTVSESHVFGANGLLVHNCDPDEAFLFSGRLVFQAGLLQSSLLECWKPKYLAEVALSTGRFEKADQGRLFVWEEPNPGERYVIGADVAEGLEHGDYSCADVLAASDGRQVAQWRGHIDPDQFGLVLKWIGKAFNRALIGVERNNHGLTTLKTLQDEGYPNLYVQEDLEHRSDDKETKKIGWLTTSKSKNKIIDQLAAELRDENHNIRCAETIKEMATFVIDETGKMGAKPGCFDDRVMARAIAGEMVLSAPRANGTLASREPYRPAQKRIGY